MLLYLWLICDATGLSHRFNRTQLYKQCICLNLCYYNSLLIYTNEGQCFTDLTVFRVKTQMKKTCLRSVTNGPSSGAAGGGPGWRTLTRSSAGRRARAPWRAWHWRTRPAVRAYWRSWASLRSPPCTVRAAEAARAGVWQPPIVRPQTALTARNGTMQKPQSCLTPP